MRWFNSLVKKLRLLKTTAIHTHKLHIRVGYATTNDATKNKCYNKQFLSINSECYNKQRCYNKHGGILSANI